MQPIKTSRSLANGLDVSTQICALLLLTIGAWVTRQSVLEPLAELGVAAKRAEQRLVLTYSGELQEVLRNAFGSQTD